jgi:bla regulator protein blaR1
VIVSRLQPLNWTAIATGFGNHLWQSTLFAIVAALLTLLLRHHHARTRYWLWLAASAKFLTAFSLLAALGGHIPWSSAPAGISRGLLFTMEQAGQPFAPTLVPPIVRLIPKSAFAGLGAFLPVLLAAVWCAGFMVALGICCARWRTVSAAVRNSRPLRQGREIEALHRLQARGSIRKRIEILLSPTSLEPGIFGLVRPVLLWPEGISERLDDAHLEAVLAHELGHVRRRDNLAAAMHMVVEAIFWFHPLVWWLGARMVEERERACDEEVLERGGDRQVYAESILKVCEFCVGSPLACVSGVTGSDLRKRVRYIMTDGIVRKLDFTRKALLGSALLLAVALPVFFGLLNATRSRAQAQMATPSGVPPLYQVTAIKANHPAGKILTFKVQVSPQGLSITGATLESLIEMAYGVQANQISGAPDFLRSETYDIEAKTDQSAADELRKLDQNQLHLVNQRMLQALLSQQFKLQLHPQTEELPQYILTVEENGPKLQRAISGSTYPHGIKDPAGHAGGNLMFMGLGGSRVTAQGVPLGNLAGVLSRQLGRSVVDQTGLDGNYDFTLTLTPEPGQRGPDGMPSAATSTSIVTAVEQQLGLKLTLQTGAVQVLVIDHAEAPAQN